MSYCTDISNNADYVKCIKNQTSGQESNTDIPFWSDDPNILFKQDFISEFFPIDTMTYEQKMNAVSRLVIFLTIIGFAFTQNIRLLIISIITLASIFLLYNYQKKEDKKKSAKKVTFNVPIENFEGPGLNVLEINNIPIKDKNEIFE